MVEDFETKPQIDFSNTCH